MGVGFVNSGLMTLNQAVWIIMGANIGTTITGQMIALNIGSLAPLIAFAGVVMVIFIKNKKIQYAGGIIAGLGVLFIGMGMMSDAMLPLRDSQGFINLMTKFSNPLLGIAAGAGFTAIIQSSSASVGILQALALGGLIDIHSAVFVLFGQNIGTCIFVGICLVTPFTDWIANFTPGNAAAQIANVHTSFNIVTTLLLLPFGIYLAKAAVKILSDKKEAPGEEKKWLEELLVSGRHLGVSAIAMKQVQEEVDLMIDKAAWNVEQSPAYVDAFYHMYTIIGNVERIGDHAVNLSDYAEMLDTKGLVLSDAARKETQEMGAICLKALNLIKRAGELRGEDLLTYIEGLEQETDDTTELYRKNHIQRMKQGICNVEASILYSEVLSDYERIGDHILNVAEACAAMENEKG